MATLGDGELTEEVRSAAAMGELGVSGIRRAGGYVFEEFLPQLRGSKAVQVYREMSDNDPTIGAMLFAFDRLLRQVEWRVEPGDSSEEQRQAAEFLEQCMNDMDHTWDEFISEALTCLVYGWAWHEIVYKRRVGPWEDDSSRRSKHTDGMIGWKRLPLRAQETWHRWVFDDRGNAAAMVQLAPPKFEQIIIPRSKSLLFRPIAVKNNPEGRSILRNAYRPWFFKKRLEEFEVLGVERDLVGMPMAKVPSEYLSAAKGTVEAALFEKVKGLVSGMRRNEFEGMVFPQEYDRASGNPLFEFSLLGGGGARQFNTAEIIGRYDERILMTVLADFILVGHQGTGSYSMHTDKTGLFRASVNTISQAIADVLNMHAVPGLFKMNNLRLDTLPKFVPNNVDPPDLGQLATFLSAMGSAGMQVFPDPELEKFVRSAAQLPKLDETEMRTREVESRYASITRVAQAKLDGLQVGQQASAAAMALTPQTQGINGAPPLPGQPAAAPGQPASGQPGIPAPPPQGPGGGQPELPPGPTPAPAPFGKSVSTVQVDVPPPPVLPGHIRRVKRVTRGVMDAMASSSSPGAGTAGRVGQKVLPPNEKGTGRG